MSSDNEDVNDNFFTAKIIFASASVTQYFILSFQRKFICMIHFKNVRNRWWLTNVHSPNRASIAIWNTYISLWVKKITKKLFHNNNTCLRYKLDSLTLLLLFAHSVKKKLENQFFFLKWSQVVSFFPVYASTILFLKKCQLYVIPILISGSSYIV